MPQCPNVVFIYADDIGYGDLSCNGSKTINTPNVQRMATEGVRFTNAHSAAATSTPSRYAMLTGEYAWRREGTGIADGDAGMIIRPERYTLADMFRDAGYATGVVGKWHLGLGDEKGTQDWNQRLSPNPADIGFDYSYIMAATGDRVPCVFVENGVVVNLDPEDPIYVSYKQNFPGEPTGKKNPDLLVMHPSHGHNQSIVNGISRIGYMKGGKSALWKDDQIADELTNKAVSFIENHKDEPFFLYFATQDAHVPRVPNERFAGKSGMGPRGDVLLQFDWSVGEILSALKKNGLDKNTIIILSSDNGPVVDDGYKDTALGFDPYDMIVDALKNGSRSVLSVVVACAMAGMIVGTVTLTGLGLKLATGLAQIAGNSIYLLLFFTMLSSIVLGMGVPTTANYLITSTICAPAIINMVCMMRGVPVTEPTMAIIMSAHLFVFYFGIVADITPPVALAAMAGSAIAKGEPFKTGVNATRLAIGAFIVPYIFVMNPAMLMIDTTVWAVVQNAATALIGMYALSGGLAGFVQDHCKWYERILLIAGGLGMIIPGTVSDLLGFAILAAIFAIQRKRYSLAHKITA